MSLGNQSQTIPGSAVHSQAKMEAMQQPAGDTANKLRKVDMVHKQSSAVTSSTLSTAGSDSSNSIAISDQDIHDLSTQEINGSTDVYFSNEYTQKVNAAAQKENEKLRLNLGLPVNPAAIARRQPIKLVIQLVHRLLLLVENPLFSIWSQYVPLKLRQQLTLLAWKMYLPVHKLLIGRRTGLHRDASLEYHALTTVIWWGRLVSCFDLYLVNLIICSSHVRVISNTVPSNSTTNEILIEPIARLPFTGNVPNMEKSSQELVSSKLISQK